MYDVAIIGSGPAGISAVINAHIRKKNYIWLGKSIGGKISTAKHIENYPGVVTTTGKKITDDFAEQIDALGITLTQKLVQAVMSAGGYFLISADNDIIEAKTVIITTGSPQMSKIKGEEALLGRGISYCATCDGNFYANKKVACLVESKDFASDIEFLSQVASHVYVYSRLDLGVNKENVIYSNAKILEVIDEDNGLSLNLSDKTHLLADGLFILRQGADFSSLAPEIEIENGHIKVNNKMETNIPGCFAAGDCTGRPYQLAKAVGDGNTALHSALEYIQETSKLGV